jgi:hypothetical protein
VIKRLSVSQVTSFDPREFGGCNRRWFFNKVEHRKEPGTKAKDTGDAAHGRLKHFLSTGEDVLDPRERVGGRFLPARLPDALDFQRLHVEGTLENMGLESHGIPFFGAIDYWHTRGVFIDENGELQREADLSTAEVGDHKTTSDIALYSKAGEDLPGTVQMSGYAEALRRSLPWLKYVRVSHNYYQTKGARLAVKRTAIRPVDFYAENWEKRIGKTVLEMKQVARETDPTKVNANEASCDAWRGCPHKASGACNVKRSPANTIRSIFQTGAQNMTLLESLRAAAGGTPPPPAVPVTPPPAPAAPVQAAIPVAPIADMREIPAGIFAPGTFKVGQVMPSGDRYVVEARADGSIVTAPSVAVPAAVPVVPAPAPVAAPAPTNLEGLAAREAGVTAPAAPAETKKPVGRPRGAKNKTGAVTSLDRYVAEKCAMIASNFDAVDIRASEADALKFGKWKGVLAACIRDQPPAAGEYTVSTGSELTEVVIEALKPLADEKGITLYVNCFPSADGVIVGIR